MNESTDASLNPTVTVSHLRLSQVYVVQAVDLSNQRILMTREREQLADGTPKITPGSVRFDQ